MARWTGPEVILGGLPVVVTVNFGWDDFLSEGWSEVEEICWQKRNGKAEKKISDKVWDRAKKYDPYFADLTQRVSENMAQERD